ncbi:protein YgfX [Shewanella insulae]|uniref:protein YgfX n=1 Tax=Shewanella insulae TaxID=2681496 RepID=UPI003CE5A63B
MRPVQIRSLPTWWSRSVVGRRHNFYLTASFDQRLSLVCFAAVCLASFLVWPPIVSLWFLIFKYGLLLTTIGFFLYQFVVLRSWSFAFWLDESGKIGLIQDMLDTQNHQLHVAEPDEQCLSYRRVWVSPLVVLFWLYEGEQKRLAILWRDMFDDTGYRHLCRLLLRFG